MKDKNIEFINDGKKININFAVEWEILDYCTQYNGIITVNFVGIILKNNKILFSFPKHYNICNENDKTLKKIMKQILYIISLKKISLGSFETGIKDEFPFKAYLEILNYYKKYGLYTTNEKYFKEGYQGFIDWNRTINKSNKIIQTNGIVYFPFVLKKKKDKNVFLSECMEYVLQDATKYKDFIDIIIPYKNNRKSNVFNDFKYISLELKKIKNMYFKDIEIRLIQNLINYFLWKSKNQDNIKLLTLSFENYWEEMIHKYLNKNFKDYKENRIIWENGQNNNFLKPEMEYIESETVRNEKNRIFYKIQYDHFIKDSEKNKIFIFDSKYFVGEVNQLNYKQLFYHYHLKYKFPSYEIINGLLIPTEKEYYTKIHIDRSDMDGVKIIEHYINLNKVLDFYLEENLHEN